MAFVIRIDARESTRLAEEADRRRKDKQKSGCAVAGLVFVAIIVWILQVTGVTE